jgi:hypothetical protein
MPICLEDVAEWLGLPDEEAEREGIVYAGQSFEMTQEQSSRLVELVRGAWKEPNRHALALAVAGVLAKSGYAQAYAEEVVQRLCVCSGDREVGDRVLAVKDTYKAAAKGTPVRAWRNLEGLLEKGDLELFRQVVQKQPDRPPPAKKEEEHIDPYKVPFRLTERQNFPTYPALMKGILPADPRGVVGYMTGLSQSFKSYLSLDWACHVSEGLDWQGHDTTQGNVLYVAGEGQYADILSRLRAWEAHHERKVENLWCRLSPINLFHPESVEEALLLFSSTEDIAPRLVILDTLSQCAGDADENSSHDARIIYRSCKQFGEKFGATVIIVHHAGKSEGAIMRGASALFDDSDFVYQMIRPGWQMRGMDATLNCMKIKNGRPIKGYELQARVVEWEEGEEAGEDLVLVPRVFESAFKNVPRM